MPEKKNFLGWVLAQINIYYKILNINKTDFLFEILNTFE